MLVGVKEGWKGAAPSGQPVLNLWSTCTPRPYDISRRHKITLKGKGISLHGYAILNWAAFQKT